MADSTYVGRFAPTPSGPLHFGSFVTALASFLDARSQGGKWLVRIEDIDTPRNEPGASESILSGLEKLGLHWDSEVVLQSQRLPYYEAALNQLKENNKVFRCVCPRKLIKGRVYPGTCINKIIPDTTQHSLRIKTNARTIQFTDQIQGHIEFHFNITFGDFIIRRSDDLYSYHLAVAVDDALQDVTHVVRGSDLLDSTACQIHIQESLDYPTPVYSHIPVAVNREGNKLSKQYGAKDALLNATTDQLLFDGLVFLGLSPNVELMEGSVTEKLSWAIKNWSLKKIPKTTEIMTDHG